MVPLANVCEITMGQAPPGASYNEEGKGLALIAGAGDFGDSVPAPKKHTSAPSKISEKGDLLLCIRASIGDLNWSDREYCLGRGVAGLKPVEGKLDKDYLWQFISANKHQLAGKGTGSTFKQVSRSHISEWQIPLPALTDQKRIALILKKAKSLGRKRQQSIDLADKFLDSVFLDMFGDPVNNPKGWPIKQLGAIADCQLGKMLSQKARAGHYPKKYLRNANVRWRSIDLSDLLEMDFSPSEQIKFGLEVGDLLVCEGGEIGRCAVWRNQAVECYFQKALHRVRVREDVLPEYLQEYFYWMASLGGFDKSVSEVTFSHLTSEKLKMLPVPTPPLSLQRQFSQIYSQVSDAKDKALKSLSGIEELYGSLAQKAFCGRL